MLVANNIITDQINQQILGYFTGNPDEAPVVDEDKVNKIVDDVYALFDSNEETSVADLTNLIVGKKYDLVPKESQPTGKIADSETNYYVKSETNENEYVKVVAEGEEEFNPDVDYYTLNKDDGVVGVLSDLQSKNAAGFENIDYDSIDTKDIENAMVDALQTMPGLTSSSYKVVEEQLDNEKIQNGKYYIHTGEGEEDDDYTLATNYEDGTVYYTKEVIINNPDQALISLIGLMLGVQNENEGPADVMRSPLRASEDNAQAEIDKEVQTLIKMFINSDRIEELADKTVNQITPLVFTGIFALFVFPWALFGLVTFIRTLRRRKCWTKLWIITVLAFYQLILGAGVTLGVRFGLSKLVDLVAGSLTGKVAAVANILHTCSLKVEFGCLMASYSYIGILLSGIIYLIITRGVKRDYKLNKKANKYYKKHASQENYRIEQQYGRQVPYAQQQAPYAQQQAPYPQQQGFYQQPVQYQNNQPKQEQRSEDYNNYNK